jgi:hypothetical protein
MSKSFEESHHFLLSLLKLRFMPSSLLAQSDHVGLTKQRA